MNGSHKNEPSRTEGLVRLNGEAQSPAQSIDVTSIAPVQAKPKERLDIERLRRRLSESTGPTYWKSLEEIAETEDFQAFVEDEFPNRAPDWMDPVNRRTALKVMASSLALAGLSACTKQPKELIVPYVKQPDEFTPGKPLFFATALAGPGAAIGLLVESHLGRPTKVEGNPDHPGSLGSTDAFAQASVLDLWDPDRSQTVLRYGDITSWGSFDGVLASIQQDAKNNGGKGIAILTRPVTSPSLAAQLAYTQQALPNLKWHQWEPVGRNNVQEGAKLAFGRPVNTVYQFENADVVVSLDSDFLTSGDGRVRYARDFIRGRRIRTNITAEPSSKADRQEGFQAGPVAPLRNQASTHVEEDTSPAPSNPVQAVAEGTPAEQTKVNRLYAIEPHYSPTGATADEHILLKSAEIEGFARDLAAALGVSGATASSAPHKAVATIAADLKSAAGRSVVIAGPYQPPAVHAVAHAINAALGNVGKTLSYTEPLEYSPVDTTQSLKDLVAAMRAGQVETLFILGGNPVYDAPADLDFAGALAKVKLKAHLSLYNDETSVLCQWQLPAAHYLETWGDARAHDGTITIQQPLIAPLYGGRTEIELLASLGGDAGRSAHDLVKSYWQQKLGDKDFDQNWRIALHDGLVSNTALEPVKVDAKMPPVSTASPASGIEIVFRPDPTIWDGSFANNGWLQELPKPTTKSTWDNAVWIAPSTAQKLNLQTEDVVALNFEGRMIEAPVWILPGHAADSITVHLGYGRTHGGRVSDGTGFNAYKIRTSDSLWHSAGVDIRKTGRTYLLAATQHQSTMAERDPVRLKTLEEYRKNPQVEFAVEEAEEQKNTLYPDYIYEGYKWGLTFDLNSCVGCNACNVACQAENNIAVVGKEETAKGRQLQWIRIDRYYAGSNLDDPEMYFQPVPCMHCENAPCELVCPGAATVHSGEGLNQMVDNRCVGTRYCSNNCPYKVRRFNFYLYSDWYTESLKGVRNPDVTVRSRGVMEKCSYCIQRINAAKILAEKENRRVRDGEIITACEQACPTQAIAFGDINDPNSRVAKLKRQVRNYGLLGELNTRPRTTYLARVRNPNPDLQKG